MTKPMYDLVVVGAGTAGCIIAARVTEAARARVLLLEAGPDYSGAIPDDLRNGNHNSVVDHDWGFSYVPDPARPPVAFPRGKVVGGSSAVNTCIALRGEPSDYDEWAKIAGPEWSWDRCLPAFVRLENDRDFGGEPYHGDAGPLPIGRYGSDELTQIQQAFLDACRASGYPECPDHNAPNTTGFGRTPLNKRGHDRVSMAEAFLGAARSRPSLDVRAHALVRRVRFDGASATGVELDSGEVIDCPNVVLCAGAVMTPPVLVRSGIGPRQTLDRLGIDAVSVREGVGARLLDHPGTLVLLRAEDVDVDVPLMQTCARATVAEPNDLFLEPLSFVGHSAVGIAVAAYRSSGAGRLVVESVDPDACPRIASHFYEDGRDVALMVAGLRRALELASSDAVSKITGGVIGLTIDASDEDLRAHVLRFSGSGYHPSGTAPMGDPDDPRAVCDQYGRVLGVTGLRVADASIMPTVPRANTNIPTAMIGERFGEWLAAELG